MVTKTVIWPPTRSHLRANTSVQKLASQYFNMYFFFTFFLICFLVIGLKRKKLFYSTGCASCFVLDLDAAKSTKTSSIQSLS